MNSFFVMFLALVAAHALCDYPLQGDFLSKAKNRAAPISGVPWWQALGAHAAIHGGAVGWITGVWWLGLCEVVAHFLTDDLKCRGKITFNQDQIIHAACKLVWVLIAASMLTACATHPAEPVIVTKIVSVPVATSCVPASLPDAPAFADTRDALKAAAGVDQRYHLMTSEWARRDSRLALLEKVIALCR